MKRMRFRMNTRTSAIIAAGAVSLVIGIYIGIQYSHNDSFKNLSTSPTMSVSSSSIAALFSYESQASSSVPSHIPLATSATTSPNELIKVSAAQLAPVASATIPTAAVSSATSARQLTSAGGSLLKSLVNIVCVSGDPSIPSISGSGVIIDSRGIILTAAHVAQLFLLQDYLGTNKVQCLIRTGSPARRAYLAEPIYVSPSWVNANLTTLTETAPKGTGQNDFALLGITATATSTPLPSSFPAIPLATADPQPDQQVAIGSYGAQYLTSSELNYSLFPILVFGSIQNRYTYDTNTVDLISVTGSAASQEGSSGGGIVNAMGQLMGVITTSSVGGDISTRSLNAITLGHIRRSYLSDTGNSLDSTLSSESVPALIANFAAQSKILGSKINQNL